jgi:DNA segregation ATPase FtsK/SpoIIIE-like protein
LSDEALEENARMLEAVLTDFGVKGRITAVRPGPVVTLYEFEPAAGVKSSRVISLSDDVARSMSAVAARIATISGPQCDRHRAAQPVPREPFSCARCSPAAIMKRRARR